MKGRPLGSVHHQRMIEVLGDWVHDGACSTVTQPQGDMLFFNESSTRGRLEATRMIAWEMFCSHCPVRVPCFLYAMTHKETDIWAASLQSEREAFSRRPKTRAVVVEGLRIGVLHRWHNGKLSVLSDHRVLIVEETA